MNDDKRLNEVIRVQKRANNFVLMDKGFLENENLSWKSKGILAYLLSKPDNWKVIVSNLVNHATDGKTAVYNGLWELSEQGYYVKRPIRNEQGNRIVQWESIVFEMPGDSLALDSPALSLLPDFQKVENLEIGNLNIENQERNNNYKTFSNTDVSNNQSSLSVGTDGQDKIQQSIAAYTVLLKGNIDYAGFAVSRPEDIQLVDDFLAIMIDALLSDTPYAVIGGENKPRELIRHTMLKLDHEDINFVLDQFQEHRSRIRKKRQYILTMLYNSRLERVSHYTNLVQSDLWNGGQEQ